MRRLFLLALAGLGVVAPSPAFAARGLETGLTDSLFSSGSAGTRQLWLDRASVAGSGTVLLAASWAAIAPGGASQPAGFSPRDPGDPAYNWGSLDEAVRDARNRGQRVVLVATGAPQWAEGENRRASAPAGSWKPKPGAIKDFGHAIARRYSGNFGVINPPPRVRHFQLWAEPNLSVYLTPQWKRGRPFAPRHYRKMLKGFHAGVKSVSNQNKVVTGGTGPYGDRKGGDRTRPLAFWRGVMCLRGRKHLTKGNCKGKAQFDVLSHHAITTSGGPRRSAIHPDDIATPDLHNLRDVLRKAERVNTVKRGRHPLWVTEFWWESNPPDTCTGVKARKHARYIAEALYLFWKQGASLAVNFLLRDQPYGSDGCGRTSYQTGLYFEGGAPKPALSAFRFPFVADRLSKRRVRLWARAPVAGPLRVEKRRGGSWKRVASRRLGSGRVFSKTIRLRGRATLRARIGSQRSLSWSLGR